LSYFSPNGVEIDSHVFLLYFMVRFIITTYRRMFNGFFTFSGGGS